MTAVGTANPGRIRGSLVIGIALIVLALSLPAGSSAAMTPGRDLSPKAVALHDGMRALWESHGTWTERAIVDFVGGLPDTTWLTC